MAKVTGTVGSLPIGSGGLSLFVGGINLGRRTWRRRVATSDYVAGEVETAATLDQTRDVVLRFRCRAATESALKTLVTSLVAAVEASTWDLILTVGSTAWPTMACTRADTDVAFDVLHARGLTASVYVYTTRNPNASGPL